jgi:hypothetical protein
MNYNFEFTPESLGKSLERGFFHVYSASIAAEVTDLTPETLELQRW